MALTVRGRQIRSRYSLAASPPSDVELDIDASRLSFRSRRSGDVLFDIEPDDIVRITLHFAQPLLWRMVTFFRFESRGNPDFLLTATRSRLTYRGLVEHGWSPRIAGPWTFARYRLFRVALVLGLASLLIFVPLVLS